MRLRDRMGFNINRRAVVAPLLAVVTLAAASLAFAAPSPAASMSPAGGSAYGFYASVSLFGGPPEPKGPEPSVELPPGGSETPVTGTQPTGEYVRGPATIFKSGRLDVSTKTGPGGSATSSASVKGFANRNERPGPFLYDKVRSTCTGATGSTTITGGVLETKYDKDTQEPTRTERVPVNPAPNTERTGTLDHVGDSYRIVFNEQTVNPDGSVTVNAAHMYLLGPTATGDLIIGQSVCGATGTTRTGTAPTMTAAAITPPAGTGTGPDSTLAAAALPGGSPGVLAAHATQDASERPGPFLYDEVRSTCTGNTGSTTITGGVLETKYDKDTQEPTETKQVPVNPAPNTEFTGTLDHVGDSYRIVFNEQINEGDLLSVNAAHMYLLGPTATGDLIIGQSRCDGGGGAYGFYGNVSLFGGPPEAKGPEPSVELPAGGSATPVTRTQPTGEYVRGPATIFRSGQLDVSTQGTPGSVTSSASVKGLGFTGTGAQPSPSPGAAPGAAGDSSPGAAAARPGSGSAGSRPGTGSRLARTGMETPFVPALGLLTLGLGLAMSGWARQRSPRVQR